MSNPDLNRVVMLGIMEQLEAIKSTTLYLSSYMDLMDVYKMIDAIEAAKRTVGETAAKYKQGETK